MAKTFKPKKCAWSCGLDFVPTSSTQVRCVACNIVRLRERRRAYDQTPKGREKRRASDRAYKQTPKGREKGRARRRAYKQTPKGCASERERYFRKQRLQANEAIANLLKELQQIQKEHNDAKQRRLTDAG